MADAVVGALRVVLGMDTASYEDGVKKATATTEDFGKTIAKAAAGIAVTLSAITGAILIGIQRTINEMDALTKQSQKVGVSVEMLSGLKLAADLTGVGIAGLGDAFNKLSKNATEAASKPMSQAANAFRAVGVEAKDSNGKVKSTSDLFLEVADKFSGLKDGAAKATLAMALFGEAGVKLIPLLNQGSDGLKSMIDEAGKLGIVISTQTAKSATEFNNTLTRLGAVKDSIFIKITAELLPALLKLSEIFLQNAKDADLARTAAQYLGDGFLGLTKFVAQIGLTVERLRVDWVALTTAISNPFNLENWKKLDASLEETQKRRMQLNASFESLDPFGTFDAVIIPVKKVADGLKDVNLAALAGLTAFDQFINSTKKSTAAIIADGQTVGQLAGFRESLRVVMQGEAVALANRQVIGEKQRATLNAEAAAAGAATLALQGKNLVYQNIAPLEAYQHQLYLITQTMAAGQGTTEQLGRAVEKLKDQFGLSFAAIGSNVAATLGQLSTLTGTFAKENKAMGIASKAFGIGQAVINTAIGITKAFATLPPPASYAAAALAAATGAAQIATISAQKFATGGSFKVGGAGGIDSQLVQFQATPGEMVDVRKPGQDRGGGRDTVVRIDPGPIPREWVEKLLDGINDAVGDGHRLRLA